MAGESRTAFAVGGYRVCSSTTPGDILDSIVWKDYRCRRRDHLMHSRSRMTIDPHIPTMPGRSTSGFHPPGRHHVHQAQGAVKSAASRMKSGI